MLGNLTMGDQKAEFANIGCIDPSNLGGYKFTNIGSSPSFEDCVESAKYAGGVCNINNSDKTAPCGYIGYRKKTHDDYLKENKNNCEALLFYFQSLPRADRDVMMSQDKADWLHGYGGKCASDPAFWARVQEIHKDLNNTGKELPFDMGGECWVGGQENDNLIFQTEEEMGACKLPVYIVPGADDKGDTVTKQMMHRLRREIENDEKKIAEISKRRRKKEILSNVMSRNIPANLFYPTYLEEARKQDLEEKVKPVKANLEQKSKTTAQHRATANLLYQLGKRNEQIMEGAQQKVKQKKKIINKMDADLGSINWSIEQSETQGKLQNKITSVLSILLVLFIAICSGLLLYYLLRSGREYRNTLAGITPKKTDNSNIFGNIFGKKSKAPGIMSSNKDTINSLFG